MVIWTDAPDHPKVQKIAGILRTNNYTVIFDSPPNSFANIKNLLPEEVVQEIAKVLELQIQYGCPTGWNEETYLPGKLAVWNNHQEYINLPLRSLEDPDPDGNF